MCCRYYYSDYNEVPHDEMLRAIGQSMERRYPGEYKTGEIFPGDSAPAIIDWHGKLFAVPASFGIPSYHKKLLLNARSETAAEKPSFAESLRERRVILPASGFFEWSHDGKKAKFYFTVDSMETIYLCGIYQLAGGKPRFVILTRAANESISEIHNRMPVIVGVQSVRPYLTDRDAAMEIIADASPLLSRKEVREVLS